MGFEECERAGAGKYFLDLMIGGTLNDFRSCKAMTEVYCRCPGAHKTVICYFRLEKTIEIFAGTPKQAIRTASSQLLPIGHFKQSGTLTIRVLLLRLLSTAESQFSQSKARNRRRTVSPVFTYRPPTTTTTSLTKLSHSLKARTLTCRKHPSGCRGPAGRPSALAGKLSVLKEMHRRHQKNL